MNRDARRTREDAAAEVEREEELSRERQRQMATLLSNLPGMAFRCRNNREWTMEFVSEGAHELTGYPASELMGNRVVAYADLIHPDDQHEVWHIVQAALGERQPYRVSYRIRTASGEERWVWEQGCGVFEGSRLCAIEGFVTDVTERKRAEEQLRDSERRYRELVQNANSVIIRWRRDGRITYFNEYAQHLFGYRAEEAIGLSVAILLPERETSGRDLGCMIQDITDDPERYVANVNENICRDGRRVWIAWTNKAILDSAGEVEEMLAIGLDITERKRAEEALRESEERLQLFIEHAPASLAMFDTEMRYLAVSRRWITDFHLEGRAILGRSHYEVFPEIPERWKAVHARGLAGEVVRAEEDPFDRLDGTRQWSRWEVRPWQSAPGTVGGIVIFSEDITERKAADQATAEETVWRRILIEQSVDGIVVIDERGKVYEANRRYAEMLGYTPEEVRHLHVWDWDTQWTRETLLEMIDTIDEAGSHFETRHRRKDGTLFDVDISNNGAVISGHKLVFCVCRDISQRKQAESSLRESEERFRTLAENLEDVVWLSDPDGTTMYFINAAYEKVWGRPRAELYAQPRSFRDAMHPDDRNRIRVEMDNHRQGAWDLEYRIERPDGTVRWIRDKASPIRSLEGRIEKMAGVAMDITERKEVEDALRERVELQNRLERIAATVPGAIYSFQLRPDGSMRIPYASGALQRLFGFKPEEVIDDASPVFALIHPDDIDRMKSTIAVSARDLSPWRLEFRFQGANGREIWVEGHSVPSRELDGSILWQGFLHDVTERRQAEERLRQLSRAVEQSPAAVVITDPTGAIEYVNPKFVQITGYTSEEVRGRNPRILKSGETPPEVYRDLWRTIKSGAEWHGEFHNRKKNGELFWEIASISPIVDEAGRITHFLGVKEDITARKRLEEDHAVLEAQLRQQQRLESIGTLAGGVAHEINNPINGIMNYAQLIQDRLPTGSPLTEFTGDILRETQRVATIVRNLLTFSRNDKVSHSPARMEDIVESTLSLVRTIIRHDQITLDVNIPEDLPGLRCRSQQIRQVIMNLMTNARDALNERYPGYNPNKQMRVRAETIQKDERSWIRVTVEDTGIGITPEVRERMFDPFFTTKPRDRGTGLGLSISHGIAQEHGGCLIVESEPGRFTRMHLDLPL